VHDEYFFLMGIYYCRFSYILSVNKKNSFT